jgi:hypothetical protein
MMSGSNSDTPGYFFCVQYVFASLESRKLVIPCLRVAAIGSNTLPRTQHDDAARYTDDRIRTQ